MADVTGHTRGQGQSFTGETPVGDAQNYLGAILVQWAGIPAQRLGRDEKKCYHIILIYLLWAEKFRLQAFCRLYYLKDFEHQGLQVKHTHLRKRSTLNKE